VRVEYIRICGRWYEVRFLKRIIVDGEACHGTADVARARVSIDVSEPKATQAEALRHEINHIIRDSHLYLDNEEDAIECLAVCWQVTMRRHPWLRRFLEGK